MNYLDRVCADGGYEDEFDDPMTEVNKQRIANLTPKEKRERYDNALQWRLIEIDDELEALDYPGKTWNEIQLIKHYKELARGDLF